MTPFLIKFEASQLARLREYASAKGVPVAGQVRILVDLVEAVQNTELSGAMVLGIKAVTTSGEVWIGKGF